MERICEPELIDEPLQAEAYAAADFSSGDRAVLERIDALMRLSSRPAAGAGGAAGAGWLVEQMAEVQRRRGEEGPGREGQGGEKGAEAEPEEEHGGRSGARPSPPA